jgi:hypothetical protein
MSLFYALTDDLLDPDDPGRFLAIVGYGPEPGFPLSILMGHVNDDQGFRIGSVMRDTDASHKLTTNAQRANLSAIRVLEFEYDGEPEEEIATRVFDRLEELGELPMGCFDPDDDIDGPADFAGFSDPDEYGTYDEHDECTEESGILDPFLEWAVETRDELLDRRDAGWGNLDTLEKFVTDAHNELDSLVKREGLDPEGTVMKMVSASCLICWKGVQQLRTPGLVEKGTKTLTQGIHGIDVAVAELAV